MTRRPALVAVGAACSTRIYRVGSVPPLPAKVLAEAAVEVTDGMAISAACAFRRLGGEAEVWARIGDDDRGRAMTAELSAAGLDVTHLRPIAGASSSHASVIVDERGDRLVVPFHDPTCDPSPAWLPLERLRAERFLLCDVRWPEGAAAAFRAARQAGCPSMLDADVAPLPVLHQLVPLADFAIFSDQALAAFTGDTRIESALRRVVADHCCEVGVSCGAGGYAWIEDGVLRHMSVPDLPVVDTLAAGDVLHGALALALSEGQPMALGVRFGVTAATLKCTRFGGRLGCPSRAEVEALVVTPQKPEPTLGMQVTP